MNCEVRLWFGSRFVEQQLQLQDDFKALCNFIVKLNLKSKVKLKKI